MMEASLAKRYSRALFQLCQQSKNGQSVLEDLQELLHSFESSYDFKELLLNPSFSEEEREKVLQAYFKKISAQELTQKFIILLNKNQRLSLLKEIFYSFEQEVYRSQNVLQVVLETAIPLSKEQLKALSDKIKNKSSAEVLIEEKINPALMGGFTLKINDQVYDASVLNQLAVLKENLFNAGI